MVLYTEITKSRSLAPVGAAADQWGSQRCWMRWMNLEAGPVERCSSVGKSGRLRDISGEEEVAWCQVKQVT